MYISLMCRAWWFLPFTGIESQIYNETQLFVFKYYYAYYLITFALGREKTATSVSVSDLLCLILEELSLKRFLSRNHPNCDDSLSFPILSDWRLFHY